LSSGNGRLAGALWLATALFSGRPGSLTVLRHDRLRHDGCVLLAGSRARGASEAA